MMGAMTGPQKLAAVKSAKGTERCDGSHKSVMEPPALDTLGEPKKPAKNRQTWKVVISCDRAQPALAMQKARKVR